MSRVLAAIPIVVVLGTLLSAPSCQPLPTGAGCIDIPAGGCPTDRGGSCADPTCSAIYACTDGAWSFLMQCDQPDSGSGAGAGTGGGTGSSGAGTGGDGGACTPVVIDTTGEATNCTPDLAFPDCPVQAALGCAESACVTGCSDFFLCVAASNPMCGATSNCWIDVAYCTDDGQLVITQ
jgi:hypothetical protein